MSAILVVAMTLSGLVAEELTEPLEKFLHQEAVYLMTPDEHQAFSSLTTNDERRAFVEAFWRKRDPRPDTPENEFRAQLLERIDEATRRFRGEGVAGWKTDRGHAFVLFGAPAHTEVRAADSVEVDVERQRYGTSPGARSYYDRALLDPVITSPNLRGRQTWYYRNPSPGFPSPDGRLLFLQDARGRWRLELDRVDNPAGSFYRPPSSDALAPPPLPTEEALAGADLIALEDHALYDMLEGTFHAGIPAVAAPVYLPHPSSHKTSVSVVVGLDGRQIEPAVRGRPQATLRLFGALFKNDETRTFVQGLSTPTEVVLLQDATTLSTLVFTMQLEPGDYMMHLGVLDTVSLNVGTLARLLTVPDFDSAELELSSLVLAKGYRSKRPEEVLAMGAGELDLGGTALAVDPTSRFTETDTIEAFLQVTGAQLPLDVRYEFWRDGRLAAAVLERTSATASIIQPLPLSSFVLTAGRYRLIVRVREPGAVAWAARESAFTILP